MSETCERCYRELEPGDEKFCKWCRRYNVVSDEAWLLRRQLAAVVAERDAARAALARVAGELSALDQWWDADVARQSVAELRGIVDAVLGKRPAGREEGDDE